MTDAPLSAEQLEELRGRRRGVVRVGQHEGEFEALLPGRGHHLAEVRGG